MFGGSAHSVPKSSSTNSGSVYDKPVYDDDIFIGVPGLKSTAAKGSRRSDKLEKGMPDFDDLLPGLRGGNAPSERQLPNG
ncbi:hypothetical protein DVH24_033044 [Malus domestica]|uniref:Uncharacterized protein n=1 Tax=Malus domestica TaxID=3750 RepID=A0A498IND1_MALDO|nr:hypothetical protein DVH24_033044 [Malus domestica]